MEGNHQEANKGDLCLHHFALTFHLGELESRLKDVRFVLVAGCARRVEAHANYLLESGTLTCPEGVQLLTGESSRFSLFKVGPILLANHGMGAASMSIALHELFLMCRHSNRLHEITLLRFGTCGGIGVAPGTICITNRALDPLFNEFVELKICLRLVRRTTEMDTRVADELLECARSELEQKPPQEGPFEVKIGATIGANDFYEEQARTNGAICEHSNEDRRNFLAEAKRIGVINMEMESNHLAAMCNKLSVPFGIVCVALNNRLQDDGVHLSSKQMAQFERRLFWIISQFIRKRLSSNNKS